MTIEIHTPKKGLEETVLRLVKLSIIRFTQVYKGISRIECTIREDSKISPVDNKVCEIRVTMYGENLFTHSRSNDYADSVREAINHCGEQIALLASKEKELPDKITTTVKV
ncbi:hypothetical protein GCM10027036_32570 [Flavihumibacter cheonanensis]|jgi:putative sigma-54 modulation protein|uniref:hypothetical protein n=1 Tax=Flavihumibacter cheonanensis TaxID=1442385 RepID=UPI001EF91717|nr:hypothetical protein [Flavihumibacter cheonanensis]MCG7752713.1 hypothetical protein [Flavihumibacter cheonanensis]